MYCFRTTISVFDMFRKKLKFLILLIVTTISLGFIMTYMDFYQPRIVPCFQVTTQNNVSTTTGSTLCVSATSGHQFEKRRPDSCSKHNHAAFLKVHKAGSTTVMDIFLRYAIQNRLNIVLPKRSDGFGFNYLGYEETLLRDNLVPLQKYQTYDILCNHVIYNRTAFRSILPNDTMYIAILREPIRHFISSGIYYYFFDELCKIYNTTNSSKAISTFLNNPSALDMATTYFHNKMSFDLGLPPSQFENITYINNYVQELDKDFALVMILEYFDESLVLMKRYLCWELQDIIYLPLNSIGEVKYPMLTFEDEKNLRKFNFADFQLYEYFQNIFGQKVQAEGPLFFQEVKHFKLIQQKVKNYCNSTMQSDKSYYPLMVPRSTWNKEFFITHSDCKFMSQDELLLMHNLIEEAWGRYNQSLKTKG
ncbi:hypothetical protein CHS0354_015787 [Potamilus streckersoni]|uniref:Uncharacterized protein n=1 Tax=Potamilus streckersoni TaxID=2493646 RepID=A0AAE0RQJ4_9BIVA|nr:hypothetical protein CHS0354_015787 [Potamilus streckersoni]